MAACRESIIDANGNIYDEILVEQPSSRTAKHDVRYGKFPTRHKAATCPKVYTKSRPQEPHDVKENIKHGFTDIIAKTVNHVKHRVTRRVTENGTDTGSISKAHMKRNLYRSRSTENIFSDSAKSPTHTDVANGPCAFYDSNIKPGLGNEFNRPLPRLPHVPSLPVRTVKRDNQDYVNTALARATVSPMSGEKSTKQTNGSGGIDTLDTVAEMDEVVNTEAPVHDKAHSSIDTGCNRGVKEQKKTEENKKDNRHPMTSVSQVVGEFEAAGEGVKTKMYVDKENAEGKRTAVKVLSGTKAEHHLEIRDMTITEIAGRLNELNLAKYVEVFKENQVDGVILANLKTEDLIQELGMKKLEAVRLKTFVDSGHIPK